MSTITPPDLPESYRSILANLILEYLSHSAYPDTALAFTQQLSAVTATTTPATAAATAVTNGHVVPTEDEMMQTSPLLDIFPDLTSLTRGEDDIMMDHDGLESHDDEEEEDEEDEEEEDRNVSDSLTLLRNGNHPPPIPSQHSLIELTDESIMSNRVLRETRLRKDIKDFILVGKIPQAINQINTHFPAVLSGSPFSASYVPTSTDSIPNIIPSVPDSTVHPRSFFIPSPLSSIPPRPAPTISPSSVENKSGSHATAGRTIKLNLKQPSTTVSPASSLVLRPTIISLNLQIQSFIELIRSASTLDSSSSSYSDITTDDASYSSASPSSPSADPMSASTSSIVSLRTTSLALAISTAQALFTQVQALVLPGEKLVYEKELADVAALMAYPDLSTSPVRAYLEQGRREELWELVNAAILVQTNRTATPLLALAVRHTTAIWDSLVEFKTGYPGSDLKDKSRPMLPPFDLTSFLSDTTTEVNENNGMEA